MFRRKYVKVGSERQLVMQAVNRYLILEEFLTEYVENFYSLLKWLFVDIKFKNYISIEIIARCIKQICQNIIASIKKNTKQTTYICLRR